MAKLENLLMVPIFFLAISCTPPHPKETPAFFIDNQEEER